MTSKNLIIAIFLAIFLLFTTTCVRGQHLSINIDEIRSFSDSLLQQGIERELAPGVAAAIVSRDSILYLKGFGYSQVKRKKTIDPRTTIFQIGSVGKIFTLISVLQQIDRGHLKFTEDVRKYAPEIPLDKGYQRPITLQDLLTHSAGLDDRLIGYAARNASEVQPLGEHLKERFPHRYIEPGEEISYSNYGYALAGYLAAKASGQNFTDYVEKNIADILGMKNTGYYKKMGSAEFNERIATGYDSDDKGFKEVKGFQRNPVPAGGVYTTAEDMTHFLMMILNDGTLNGTNVYDSIWQSKITSQQFTHHPWLTGYTLGFEEQNFNGVHAIAKGGNVPGFVSEIVIFPEDGIGIFLATNASIDALLEEYMNGFTDKFIQGKNLFPEAEQSFDVSDYTGWYRINRHNRHDIEDLFELFQGQIHITSPEPGVLQMYHDGNFHKYKAINDTVFQSTDDLNRLMVFFKENGKVISMANGFKIEGILVPAKYEKLSWIDTNDFLNEWLALFILIILSFLLVPVFRMVVLITRGRKPAFLENRLLPPLAFYSALIFSLFTFIWIAFYFIPILKNSTELLFGMPPSLKFYPIIPIVQIIMLILIILSALKLFRSGIILLTARVYFLLFTLSSVLWIFILNRWHFIGFNY